MPAGGLNVLRNKTQILDKIKTLEPDTTPANRTKKVTVTIPTDLIELVEQYQKQRGYQSKSQTVTRILESFFNQLLDK